MWEELSVPGPGGGSGRDEDAGSTLEEEVDRAYRRGVAHGEQAGLEAARKDLEPGLQAVAQVSEQLAELRKQWAAEMERNLAALSVAIARLLVAREIKEEPEIISGLVGKALAQFPLDQAVRIRVNPLDLSNISGALPGVESRAPVSAGREVRWIPDASIGTGGCVVEGPERIVDGRIDAALERVYRRLTDG
jgi:flagellar biosynthesis/type III secretory pathway protein FliH